ncbi:MAG: hypothetical protein ACRD34_12800 [Bryobacteraceae bacterium]
MQCIETEIELKADQQAAKPLVEVKSGSTKNTQRKSWNGVAVLASAVGLGSVAGLIGLYFYAVSAVQSALSAFHP